MSNTIQFYVQGEARAQGSKRPVPIYRGKRNAPRIFTGKVTMMEGCDKVATQKHTNWRLAVQTAANNAKVAQGWQTADEPALLQLTFYMARPKKPRFDCPASKPDLSKLVRAVEDSLTTAGIFADDGRVTKHVNEKKWADEFHPPGVEVIVRRLNPSLV